MPAYKRDTIRKEIFCKECKEWFVHYIQINKCKKLFCENCVRERNNKCAKLRRNLCNATIAVGK